MEAKQRISIEGVVMKNACLTNPFSYEGYHPCLNNSSFFFPVPFPISLLYRSEGEKRKQTFDKQKRGGERKIGWVINPKKIWFEPLPLRSEWNSPHFRLNHFLTTIFGQEDDCEKTSWFQKLLPQMIQMIKLFSYFKKYNLWKILPCEFFRALFSCFQRKKRNPDKRDEAKRPELCLAWRLLNSIC